MSLSWLGRGDPRKKGRQASVVAFVALYVVAAFALAHGSLFGQGLLLTAAVFAVLALSVNLVASTGLYSLASAGLFAVGAYLTAILSAHLGLNVFVLLPVSVAACAVFGVVLGALSLRVSGIYFTISTFIFTLIVNAIVSILGITGGYSGLMGPIFPGFPSGSGWLGTSLAWLIMLVLLIAIAISWGVKRSALYPILLAIRDSEPLAVAMGARTSKIKLGIFGLSAGLAGTAGWAFSFLGIISPGQFAWGVAVNILAMVVLGGMNTTVGPILGAAFISIFPVYVNISPLLQEIIFGSLFVIVIVAFPQGLMGLISGMGQQARRAFARQQKPASETEGSDEADGTRWLSSLAAGTNVNDAEAVPAVVCSGVSFRYGNSSVRALDGVDFTATWGTIHGLIGPNGSGKTTLVDLISGRIRPESGTIELAGERVDGSPATERARQGLMRTFQSARLVSSLTCRSNVCMGLYSHVSKIGVRAPVWPLLRSARRDMKWMEERALAALSFVGAAEWTSKQVADVPHGAVQLTQLAAVCVGAPRVILLDEPLAGLSPGEIEHVGTVLTLLKSAGVCVILIEHQPRFVFALCDEVTVLNAGVVVASGAAGDVRVDARVREVYLGQ